MKHVWKRGLSLLLALTMIVGMMPLSVFAAEVGDTATTTTDTPPADVDDAVWVKDESTLLDPNPKTTCGLAEHTHGTGCYTKSCDHNDGHISTCYSESTSYALCQCEENGLTHTGSVTLTDVVTISGTDAKWVTDHPAYPVVYAVYKAAYDKAYKDAEYLKEVAGKAAGVAALVGKEFCYTVSTSATPDKCTHTCSDVGGSCYTKICIYSTEHTHDPAEGGCYEYSWTLKADVNNNELPDEDETYTVIYADGLGNELSKNEGLAYGAATPTISDPTRTGYTFTGWTPGVAATVDTPTEKGSTTITYTATWKANEHTITWNAGEGKFADGTTEKTTTANYDSTPAAPEVPTKAGDAQYTWTFAGWSPSVSAVTGDTTYTATYTSDVNSYTVTWNAGEGKFADGTGVKTDTLDYGETPVAPADPTRAASAQYTWTFAGWSPAVDTVTGAVTYTATYSSTVNTYTVTWKGLNAQGQEIVLETDENVAYGTKAEYNGNTPSKPSDALNDYIFAGWDKTPGDVTGDVTYTAQFTADAITYTVTFYIDGEKYAEQTVTPVTSVSAPTVADKDGYNFYGWYTDAECTAAYTFGTVAADIALYAKYVKQVTVTFDVNGGVGTVEPQTIDVNSTIADVTAPTMEGYDFVGWTLNGEDFDVTTPVTGDITLVAKFAKHIAHNTTTDTYYSDLHKALTECGKGETVQLLDDVDLSGTEWTPVGGDSVYFAGEFDGQGHTISNLTQTQGARMGLFGLVEKAYIHDLTLKNVQFTVNENNSRVGAIAGNLQYWNVLENITIDGISITVNGNDGLIGAVTGYEWKSQQGNVDVKNAVFTVNGSGNVIGGHTAYARGHVWDTGVTGNNTNWLDGTVQTINETEYVLQNYWEDCDVTNITIALNGTNSEAGGFIGSDTYNSHSNYFVDCHVTGLTVNCAEGTTQTVGGFIAWNNGTTTAGTVKGFEGCSVTGTINGANGIYGGFAGQVGGRACAYYGAAANVDITSTGTAGGFVGVTNQYFTHAYTFTNCTAEGDVSGKVAGGFAGKNGLGGDGDNLNVTYTNCSAAGAVMGSEIAGGFIGEVNTELPATNWSSTEGTGSLVLQDNTAAASVTSETGYVGYLIGYFDGVANGDAAEGNHVIVELGGNTPDGSDFAVGNYHHINLSGDTDSADIAVAVAKVGTTNYTTLADAVAAANAVEGGATVELLKDITLGEKLTVTGNVTVEGAYTITRDAAYTGTLFAVSAGASLTLDGGLTIDGANNYSFDSELYKADLESYTNVTDAEKYFTPAEGAPVAAAYMITTAGTVNLNEVTIQNHYSKGSGIVSASSGANVTLDGAKITHCANVTGSGLVVNASAGQYNKDANLIQVTMNEGTVIDGNHVGGNHGIFKIYLGTTFTMNGGEIKNTTGWNSNGTVVGTYYGTFVLSGGTICSNSSVNGPNNARNAAVYIHNGSTFNMSGGTICHNSGAYGGVDSPKSSSVATITGGSIVNNNSVAGYQYTDIYGGTTTVITGGTFTQNVDKWCADGFKAVETEPGVWGIAEAAETVRFWAPIAGGYMIYISAYENRDAAQEYADATALYTGTQTWKIELLADVTMDSALTIASGYTTTIEAGAYKLLGKITVEDGASLTICSGTFNDEDAKQYVAEGYRAIDNGDGTWTVYSDDYRTVTIQVNGQGTVTVNGNAAAEKYLTNESLTIVAAPVVSNGISKTYVSSITVNGVEQTLTYGPDYSVTIPAPAADAEIVITFAEAGFTLSDDNTMTFYPGIQTPTYKDLYTTVITAPAYNAEYVTSVKYLARVAGTQELDLSELGAALADMDGLAGIALREAYKALVGDDGLYELQLGDLWLDVGDPIPEVDIKAVTDAEIDKIKAMIAAGDTSGAIRAMGDLVGVLAEEAYYLGAHDFGYNPDQLEYVEETLHVVYENDAMKLEDKTIVIKLTDDRTNTVITGSNVEFEYKDYTEESLMAAIGATVTDEAGNPVAGTVYKVQSTANKPVGEYVITLKFDGNENYKPAEATVTLTVIKAPSVIDVPNVNVTYGDAYDANPVVTNKYNQVIEIDTIRMIIGLDVAELDINGDGITGLTGRVQLLVPDDLQTILNLVGMEDGATMTLSEFVEFLNDNAATLEGFGLTQEMVDAVNQALVAIGEVAETGDLEITLGGTYPVNTGAYLQVAVTANANYETAMDVGYIIIKPDATQVYLDWNYTDSNGIFSHELLQKIDLSASAYNDKELTVKNDAATELVQNLFVGIDENGELVTALDGSALGNGAYTQLSFIAEFGNAFYYAVPIARAFIIVPNVENVQLVDEEGNALDSFTFSFDNTNKTLYVSVDGKIVPCEIKYYGVQTNARIYNDVVAPKHAGVYTAVVFYVVRDEAGEVIAVGQDMAALIIEPAESAVKVPNTAVDYDGQAHKPTINVSSSVPGLRPDTTVLTAVIKVNGEISDIGLDAIEGNANIDFPRWLDEILSQQFADAYANGIAADDLVYKINQYKATLIELGISENVIADVVAILEQIPASVTVTFADDITFTEPGVYLIGAAVTDSDHIPSADLGVLVIQKQPLEFDLVDTTVTWDGMDHFADMVNPDNSDYVAVIIDRENNIGNILLEDDLSALISVLESALGYELPDTIDVAAIMTAIDEILADVEGIEELPINAADVLARIREGLSKLPQSGTVYINGALPTDTGTYEIYAVTYSAEYQTAMAQAVLEIVPVQIKVTVDDAQKYYGETDPSFSYRIEYFDHLGNALNGFEIDVTVDILRDKGENAGEYDITASVGITDENYTVAEVTDGTLTIKPAEIEITVDSATKTYGEDDPEFTYTVGTVNGVVCEDLTVEITRVPGEDAGEYAITADILGNKNYKVITQTPGTLTIEKAKVTVTVSDAEKFYGEEDDFHYTVDGWMEDGAILVVTYDREQGEGVGSYVINANACMFMNDNYDIAVVPGKLTVKPAEITIEIDDQTKIGHAADPELTYTAAVVNGQVDLDSLNIRLSREEGWAVGEYAITASYTESENWNVTVSAGKLTIAAGDYVCWNMATGVYYDDLSDALEEADDEAAETVQMLKSYEEKYVVVAPGTTLDLNGLTVTARFVVGMNDSHIVDHSQANTGLMKVAQKNIELFVGNEQVPLYDADLEGYVFTRYAINQQMRYDIEDDTAKFNFVAYIEPELYTKYFGDGATDNDACIAIEATWHIATGTVTEHFVYTDVMVGDVTNSNAGLMYTFLFSGYSEFLQYGDITLTATIQSGTDVVAAGTTLVIKANN